jgi:23S rRNA A1618 N6-methylase RlmF
MMSKVDEILAKQKELEEQLKLAMEEERDAVLKDIKDKIKRFDFKATDFKGLLKSRVTQKQVEDFLAKKAADAKKSATAKKSNKG